VEPPGLFRGRGEHPKMGRIKRRIYPKDIVINIGKGVPIPEHPYPDQHWKMVRQLMPRCTNLMRAVRRCRCVSI
jgi:DNA topoisomerase I